MVGATPKFKKSDHAGLVTSPGATRHAQTEAGQHRAGSRWRALGLLLAPAHPALVLVQWGTRRRPAMLAANFGSAGGRFTERFPTGHVKDRFPDASESFAP